MPDVDSLLNLRLSDILDDIEMVKYTNPEPDKCKHIITQETELKKFVKSINKDNILANIDICNSEILKITKELNGGQNGGQ